MIIKNADDKKFQLNTLRTLLSHPDADANCKKRIEQEIRNIQAGARGEDEAAYEMMVHYGQSKNWMIIHDLRVEHDGLVAQIDHLLINRYMDIWVCESKHFSEGISINEHGEFTAFFGHKPYGVASPIEQNNRHMLILRRLFDAGVVKLPTRLGFTIKPDLKSLILVSKRARISRPKKPLKGLDVVIKNDLLFKTVDRVVDEHNPLMMAKLIGQDTLKRVADEIVALHKPIIFDWHAKFGLSKPVVVSQVPVDIEPVHTALKKEKETAVSKEKTKLICHRCNEVVPYNVAKFCWFNKPKFGGQIYCLECQKTVLTTQ